MAIRSTSQVGFDGDLDAEIDADAPLILLGDTFQDGTRYSGVAGIGSGNAIAFDHAGNDVFNITSTAGVTVYGGSGDDAVHGGSGDDNLFGGSGHDVIEGRNGNDRIFGDSGLNADLSTRFDLAGPILSIVVSTSADTLKPNRDLLVAGDDTLSGGDGNDIVFGDHGTLTQAVIRPADLGVVNDPADDIKASTNQLLLTSRGVTVAQTQSTTTVAATRSTVAMVMIGSSAATARTTSTLIAAASR